VSRSALSVAAACATLSSCAGGSPQFPDGSTPEAQTAYFALYSDPWINLHHFLYAWAQREAGVERSELSELPAAERAAWLEVVSVYRDSVISNGFQATLNELKRALARPGDSGHDDLLIRTLSRAMPIYEERWWPQHHQDNTDWIANVAPKLAEDESGFVHLTRRLYAADWSAAPWRIDVSAYAPRLGYATPTGHVVVRTTDPANRQLSGMELIFHEMQHVAPIAGTLPSELERAFFEAGAGLPDEIGHALIYLTAGEYVRAAASARSEEHVPFWIARRFDELPQWQPYAAILEAFWLPAVRGETTASQGLANIAESGLSEGMYPR
jgi:hypothetical protein